MPEEIGRRVVAELRAAKERGPVVPTKDIQVVWVVSGPGTVKSPPEKGPYAKLYAGKLPDKDLVDRGVALVREITALRMERPQEAVAKSDIAAHGPILLYNGEDLSHPKTNFPQNEDLREKIQEDDFPLPLSNVAIRNLTETNTSGQITDLAEFLERKDIKKVAVVAGGAHMPRVLRGLKKHETLFPSIDFVPVHVRDTHAPVGRTHGEIRRIREYTKPETNYIAKDPITE